MSLLGDLRDRRNARASKRDAMVKAWRSSSRTRAKGFSLPELLVAIGIIGLLIALMLPSVQRSRESARRTHCLNNLRQIGSACMAHVSVDGTFPPTNDGYNSELKKLQSISPHVGLLPYLEQQAIFAQFNPAETGLEGPNEPPSSAVNAGLIYLSVPTFQCPSDRVVLGGNSYRANMGIGPAIFGGGVGAGGWDRSNGSGAFGIWRAMAPSRFSDGLSNTALFSEKLIGDSNPALYTPYRDYFFAWTDIYTIQEAEAACSAVPLGAPPQHESYGGHTWLFGSYKQTWYNHIRGPNSPQLDCAMYSGNPDGAHTARSFHDGGVNLLLADGSARLVGDAVNIGVWRALATRAHADGPVSEDL